MRVLILTAIVTILDQLTKFAVKGVNLPWLGFNHKGMEYGSSINVISSFFRFTFIENPGMAFGLEVGGKLALSFFTIAATVLIVYFIYINRNENIYTRIALAFILGGALGNLVDRIFYGLIYGYAPLFFGKVVDFMQVDFPDFKLFGKTFYSWPIFNVADIAVTIGFLMIIFGYNKVFKKHNTVEHSEHSAEIINTSDESVK